MDFWQVLPVALALMLIFEGVMPFLSPDMWRRWIAQVAQADDQVIRLTGLSLMIVGVISLYLVTPR